MKKFTFLLTLLGLSASSAFAGVFTPSTDSESHLFAIKNPSNNYYCTVNGAGIGSTQNKGAVAFLRLLLVTKDSTTCIAKQTESTLALIMLRAVLVRLSSLTQKKTQNSGRLN